jgi:hypothetical protein
MLRSISVGRNSSSGPERLSHFLVPLALIAAIPVLDTAVGQFEQVIVGQGLREAMAANKITFEAKRLRADGKLHVHDDRSTFTVVCLPNGEANAVLVDLPKRLFLNQNVRAGRTCKQGAQPG